MFLEVASVLAALFVSYSIYVLFFDIGTPGMGGPLDDYIDDDDGDDDPARRNHNSAASKYSTSYEELGKQILIFYGSEYGFTEEVARKLFDRFQEEEESAGMGLQPRILNSKHYQMIDHSREQVVLYLFSTTGDGVPPSESRDFVEFIVNSNGNTPSLTHLKFSVLALGDSNYPHFCKTGRTIDARLHQLKGQELFPRVDVDLEDWEAINKWMDGVVATVMKMELETATDYLDLAQLQEDKGFSRIKPFWAKISDKLPLTSLSLDGTEDKETIHVEVDISGSDMVYTSGDAIGIVPVNHLGEVESLVSAFHCSGEEKVPLPATAYEPKPATPVIPLKEALLKYYDLKVVKMDLVKLLGDSVTRRKDVNLAKQLLSQGLSKTNTELVDYVSSHEVIDVLKDFSSFSCFPSDILKQLKGLQPRYYSIASSPAKNAESVSVCAAVVRYSLHGTPRTGVCTTFLQDRVGTGDTIPVFISTNHDFRLPSNGDVPIVMIGPGTGLAPFRAFIQERVIKGAGGRNVLYFGCRQRSKDYLYGEELERWASDGTITLRKAFSRDQPHKVYVQHLLEEDCDMIWDIVNDNGGHIYVCGDAKQMAGDVHKVLVKMVEEKGNLSTQEADEYLTNLEGQSRYQKDVWVT